MSVFQTGSRENSMIRILGLDFMHGKKIICRHCGSNVTKLNFLQCKYIHCIHNDILYYKICPSKFKICMYAKPSYSKKSSFIYCII